MGATKSKQPKIIPGAQPYANGFQYEVQPLDLVLFKGNEFVSNLIRYLERREFNGDMKRLSRKLRLRVNRYADAFSHCGLVITSEICADPRLVPGKRYLLESNLSGKLTDGVLNIEGQTFFGVQVRDLDLVVPAYNALSDSTRVAFAHLKPLSNPLGVHRYEDASGRLRVDPDFRKLFTEIYCRYIGRRYDYNPLDLAAIPCHCLRGEVRDDAERLTGSRGWVFCSELVADIYRDLGILPPRVDTRNVVPTDFLVDASHQCAGYVEDPIYVK